MAKTAPVLFFAFANDRAVEKRYLRNLPEEERRLREAMDKARWAGRCQVEVRYNATPDAVWNVFLDPELKGRIAVFHFAGHAGGTEILLETREGAAAEVGAEGLAGFLGLQEGLQAVFLNGCSTEPQVKALLASGVPVVIATSRAIGDRVATEFSTRFYQSLAADAPLGIAFQEAVHLVRSQSPAPSQAGAMDDWPWRMHGEERDKAWKLSNASGVPARSREKIDVPEIFPYLCDRGKQEGPLEAVLTAHRSQASQRPLAVLIPGDYRHAADRFIDRLQDPTLPRFLGKAPLRRVGPLSFRDPGVLERDLAEKLCSDRNAGLSAMAEAVAAFKSPVMVDVVFTLEDGQPDPKPELVSVWLSQLGGWPDLPHGQDLVFLLRFSYRDPRTPSRLLFWRTGPSGRARKLLARIMARQPAGLGMAELPPLEDVRESEVREWIDQHVRALACKVAGEDRDLLICDQLKAKALGLFRAVPSLPMEDLAPLLRSQLLECLQQGGN